MSKRKWKVELRSRPQSDGLERLGQAVRLLLARGQRDEADVMATADVNEPRPSSASTRHPTS